MGSSQRSSSHLWELAIRKLFPKRASQSKDRETFVPPAPQDSEHTDGFYMYSQSLLDQETRRLENLKLQASDSTEISYSSAMAPIDHPLLAYNVSSPEWNVFSHAVNALDEPHDEHSLERLGSVLTVFFKVYTIAKIVVMIFVNYGVELDDSPDDILAHLKQAEEVVTSDSLAELIESIENLYYSTYARLIMEIANVELCASYNLEFRRLSMKDNFFLPEPSHLYKIFMVFKEALDASTVCATLDYGIIKQHQDQYIHNAMGKAAKVGFSPDDLLGYRRYILAIISDASSPFSQKWKGFSLVYQMPPEEIITVLSEKYLSIIARAATKYELPASELPFINPETIDPVAWEREVILDHRQATLAKLEGKSLGEVRREDDRRRLIDFVKERKCICPSTCNCAIDCTFEVERPCPCSERMMRFMLAKRRRGIGRQEFGPRCNGLARAFFEGFSAIRREADDFELAAELDRAFHLFEDEVRKQRNAVAKANGMI